MLDSQKIPIVVSTTVKAAIHHHKPVVALESTVITHGLPYPRNLELFLRLETILKEAGVVPATIIVLDGIAHVGIDEILY
ncbi:MAG: pseudouridine-5'-phosphate glycosidase, partial [Candidatus Cloacimonadaceae bacterium]|nr:pseudouridine-5'-phosphate glycosidase [Candidatus Cloacimonadaceae bacterium]